MTGIEIYENDEGQVFGEAELGGRHETPNYVRFTGGGEFTGKRGGPRITVYLSHEDAETLGVGSETEAVRITIEAV